MQHMRHLHEAKHLHSCYLIEVDEFIRTQSWYWLGSL